MNADHPLFPLFNRGLIQGSMASPELFKCWFITVVLKDRIFRIFILNEFHPFHIKLMSRLCLQGKTIYYGLQNTQTRLILASTKFVDEKIFPNTRNLSFNTSKFGKASYTLLLMINRVLLLKISPHVKDDVLES